MKILIIIPAYNEEENIEKVICNLEKTDIECDYLVINDCSKDNTRKILENNQFNYVNNPINLGIGGGVQLGYIYALENGYDIAIQMDGDGQHNPEYLAKLIEPILQNKADMTIGSRFIEKEGFQSSSVRRIGIKFLSMLIKICCGVNVKDVTSGYRAVNCKLIKAFSENYAQDYPEPEAIIYAAMKKMVIREVPVIMNERAGGVSSISPIKSVYYMIKVSIAILMTRFTY